MKEFLDHFSERTLFLGSRSPRRKELLEKLGIPFEIWLEEEVVEEFPANFTGPEAAVFLGKLKSKPYEALISKNQIVITADTIVCLEDQILGKPKDESTAVDMLTRLSGHTHQVITGVNLLSNEKSYAFSASTSVTFAQLRLDEILYYVENFSPYDKAGAYGIQEWVGLVGVESIEGSYFNVMGLPVQRLFTELKTFTNFNT